MEPENTREAPAVASAMPAYRWRPRRDVPLFLRATATNQIARLAPGFYTRLTGETGRGQGEETAESVAEYFLECMADYRQTLARVVPDDDATIRDATIVEYGPGDVPGVALAFTAAGARRVICVDRFALIRPSGFNQTVLDRLGEQVGDEEARARYERARQNLRTLGAGQQAERDADVAYRVDRNGYSGLDAEADLIISRAVLEHVNDLEGTFRDMHRALRPGGIAMHKVDLRSHGLHRETPLDFLTWPRWAWWCMHSNKGTPNRWRLDRYRDLADAYGFELLLLEPVESFSPADVEAVRHALADVASAASGEDLTVATFWLVVRKPSSDQQ